MFEVASADRRVTGPKTLFRLPRARVPEAGSEPYYIAFRLPIKPLDPDLSDRVEGPSGRR